MALTGAGRGRHADRLNRGEGADRVYLYGRNVVEEAIEGGRQVRRVLVATGAHGASVEAVLAAASRRGVPVDWVARAWLDAQTEDRHHQGVAAEVAPYRYARLEDVTGASEPEGGLLVLALDSVQDPQNFGTLLRTAAATGVSGVLIPEHRAVGVTPGVERAAAGATARLRIAQVTNLTRALEDLKRRGIWVYGLAMDGARPFWEVDWRSPSAVVVGAEGRGLSPLVRSTCDEIVRIPMRAGGMESLNAGVAGSLVLYEAYRQRGANELPMPSPALLDEPRSPAPPDQARVALRLRRFAAGDPGSRSRG